MNFSIIESDLRLELHGFSGIATNNNWVETGFKLMDQMWKQVKSNDLKNKGLNVWVYEGNNCMFAGVELEDKTRNHVPLESKNVTLTKYVYYKHVGPYNQIREAGSKVQNELQIKGIKTAFPYVEIYGHWSADESKLETELIWCLK